MSDLDLDSVKCLAYDIEELIERGVRFDTRCRT